MPHIEIIQTAFENVAGHMSNLDAIRSIITMVEKECSNLVESIQFIEKEMAEAEVTLKTDMRILLNEIKHVSSRGPR